MLRTSVEQLGGKVYFEIQSLQYPRNPFDAACIVVDLSHCDLSAAELNALLNRLEVLSSFDGYWSRRSLFLPGESVDADQLVSSQTQLPDFEIRRVAVTDLAFTSSRSPCGITYVNARDK